MMLMRSDDYSDESLSYATMLSGWYGIAVALLPQAL